MQRVLHVLAAPCNARGEPLTLSDANASANESFLMFGRSDKHVYRSLGEIIVAYAHNDVMPLIHPVRTPSSTNVNN